MVFIYELEGISGYGIYLCFVYLLRIEVYQPWASSGDKKWAIGWTQPDLFPSEVVNLIIGLVRIYWLDGKAHFWYVIDIN